MAYTPSKPPSVSDGDAQALASYLNDELQVIASSLRTQDPIQMVVSFAVPNRPRTGMIAYADGIKWNPGAEEGLYEYGSDGTWHFITRNITSPVPTSQGGTGDTGATLANLLGAWTAYTPTLTANVNTFTTASAAGRYKQVGKTVYCHVTVTITTVGSGQYPQFTLPVVPLDINKVSFYGMDRAGGNNMLVMGRTATVPANGIVLIGPASANPAISGTIFEVTSVYEAA